MRTELAGKDIIDELVWVFGQIAVGGIIDRSLVLEWNVWRVLAVLDDGDIRNNFKMDRFGQPVTHAPGNVSDIECTYGDFHLLTEVTVSYASRQHATEGEPVTAMSASISAGRRTPVIAGRSSGSSSPSAWNRPWSPTSTRPSPPTFGLSAGR